MKRFVVTLAGMLCLAACSNFDIQGQNAVRSVFGLPPPMTENQFAIAMKHQNEDGMRRTMVPSQCYDKANVLLAILESAQAINQNSAGLYDWTQSLQYASQNFHDPMVVQTAFTAPPDVDPAAAKQKFQAWCLRIVDTKPRD